MKSTPKWTVERLLSWTPNWAVLKEGKRVCSGATEHDARRIAACLQACEAIETQTLKIVAGEGGKPVVDPFAQVRTAIALTNEHMEKVQELENELDEDICGFKQDLAEHSETIDASLTSLEKSVASLCTDKEQAEKNTGGNMARFQGWLQEVLLEHETELTLKLLKAMKSQSKAKPTPAARKKVPATKPPKKKSPRKRRS